MWGHLRGNLGAC